jgi:predicted nucleotidyltransferase
MTGNLQDDQILKRLRSELKGVFGERLEKVVLYGSRARGDAAPDSDYDVAVFLKEYTDRFEEFDRIVPIQVDILDATGAVISPLVFRAEDYVKQTGLMHNIRAEGIPL